MQRNPLLLVKAKTMADVISFESALERQMRESTPGAAHKEEFSFWPEVSSGLWIAGTPQTVDPANGEKRVLFEMVLVLGTVAAIAVAISLFVGAVPPV